MTRDDSFSAEGISLLIAIMKRLRDPVDGCPWDLKQTFESLAPYAVEEAWEVADAVYSGDRNHIKEELGDLLLQVVFQSQLADEEGAFAFDDVANAIAAKLLRRHPHVFPDGTVHSRAHGSLSAEEVTQRWNQIKDQENRDQSSLEQKQQSVLDGIKKGLPPLMRALLLQQRAATVNFDWSDIKKVLFQLREEINEFEESLAAGDQEGMFDELGDVFFTAVNLARHANIDVEQSLLHCNNKFESRFKMMERLADRPLQACSLQEQELLWSKAKDYLAALENVGGVVPKNELKFQLQRLNEALHSIETADQELRETLLTLSSEINRLLVKDESNAANQDLVEALERESIRFSIEHPTISTVINEIVAILGRMGI